MSRQWRAAGALVAVAALAGWVAAASRAGTRVEGCPVGCATAGPRPAADGTLRVLSLNVLHGFPAFEHLAPRLDRIAAEIRDREVDVALLQEVPWTLRLGNGAAYLARRTGLNYAFLRANGNRRAILFEEGEAILSRYPLKDLAGVELQPPAGPFQHRVALRATAATPMGDVDLVVTHLSHNNPQANRRQAAFLQTFVETTGTSPALVGGDFNATEDTPQIGALASAWTDVYRAAHPDDKGATCCVDAPGQGPGERLEQRIDYLFLVPRGTTPVRVLGAQRVLDQPFPWDGGWLWASDHVGILAEFAVER